MTEKISGDIYYSYKQRVPYVSALLGDFGYIVNDENVGQATIPHVDIGIFFAVAEALED